MIAHKLSEYCLSKPGAIQEYPYGPEPVVYKVGGKVFATIYTKDGTTRFGMKCEPLLADLLCQQYSSVTMMYKSPNWIYIHENGDAPDDVVCIQIDHSYDLIVKSLTKKAREQIQAEAGQKKDDCP